MVLFFLALFAHAEPSVSSFDLLNIDEASGGSCSSTRVTLTATVRLHWTPELANRVSLRDQFIAVSGRHRNCSVTLDYVEIRFDGELLWSEEPGLVGTWESSLGWHMATAYSPGDIEDLVWPARYAEVTATVRGTGTSFNDAVRIQFLGDAFHGRDWDGDGYISALLPDCETECSEDVFLLHDGCPCDCDDDDPLINPGAPERCDLIDWNCDGDIHEGAIDAPTWWLDDDGDSYGDPAVSVEACEQPEGYVDNDLDCAPGDPELPAFFFLDDDGDGYGRPDVALLACDPPEGYVDNDLDCAPGDPTLPILWFADIDGDGYGDPSDSVLACEQPPGYVDNDLDCAPGDPDLPALWYRDADGDGFGDPDESVLACEAPPGFVDNDLDCAPDNPSLPAIFYRDGDGDGFGDPSEPLLTCAPPDDYVDNDLDCAPGDPDLPAIWYLDDDGDGYGDPDRPLLTCESDPEGYVDNDLDCAPGNPDLPTFFFFDGDGDGFGDPEISVLDCEAPESFVDNDLDCDDGDEDIHPEADEIPGDGVDQNCDGVELCFQDLDLDTYRTDTVQPSALGDILCEAPGLALLDLPDGDCDDGDGEINPGATEIYYDGVDQNCDQHSDYDPDRDGLIWPDYADLHGQWLIDYPDYPDAIDEGVDCYDTFDTPLTSEQGQVLPGEIPREHTWYNGIDDDCSILIAAREIASGQPIDLPNDFDQDGDGWMEPGLREAFVNYVERYITFERTAWPELELDPPDYGLHPYREAFVAAYGADREAWGAYYDTWGRDCDDEDPTAWPGARGWSLDCERSVEQDGSRPVPTPEELVAEGSGCACSSASSTAPVGWLAALGLLGAVFLRRRS